MEPVRGLFLLCFAFFVFEIVLKRPGQFVEVVQIIERDENTTSKLGLCPPYFALPHEGCLIECHSDAQCAGDSKCCFAGCGYTCVSPIPIATAKPGQCPVTLLPDVAIVEGASEKCDQHCVDDTECGGNKKCCSRGKCDLVCLDPVGKSERTLFPDNFSID
jgi:WAP-type (Whey Acidic Protein) 'four-disulfide core'